MTEPVQFIAANRAEIDALIAEAMPALTEMAAKELAGCKGELMLWPVDLLTPLSWFDEQTFRDGESDYRRGYYHGFSAAMDDLRPACKPSTWAALAEFFDDALRRWRSDDPAGLVHPPQPRVFRG
jgi:hypothetical protein